MSTYELCDLMFRRMLSALVVVFLSTELAWRFEEWKELRDMKVPAEMLLPFAFGVMTLSILLALNLRSLM